MLKISKIFLEKKEDDFSLEDVEKLQEIVKSHNDLYYNQESPVISDKEYDDLFKKLRNLERKFRSKLKWDLVTSRVWADFIESSFNKVKHSRPMTSLDNTYNEKDLKDFDERVKSNLWFWDDAHMEKNYAFLEQFEKEKKQYTIEFKFDGLWIELIYKKWTLVRGITRWNWIEWEDITQNIMQIDNIPKTISYKEHIEIRWEVVMPISSFEELNKQAKINWEKVFSNPRNAASWSVRMKDNRITKKRKLKFFAYDLANFEEFKEKEKKDYYYDVIKDLENFWFDISSYFEICDDISEVINKIETFWDLKKSLDFEIDGLVIKVNNINFWEDIWYTQHHPRYAIAYKFPAEILTTKILSVDHQIWRTWTITPVANLEPINIGWVIVKRATLHNYEEVENLDARIWDTVFIKRAWEVIPKIISVIKEGRNWTEEKIQVPEFCPSCWTKIQKDEWKVRYYCPNDWLEYKHQCRAKTKEKLIFAVSKEALNIDWLWKRQIELFLEKWIIKDLIDIFRLEEKKDKILELEWFQEKSVNNILTSIEKAKNLNIKDLLVALQISSVWKKTASELSKLFQNKEDLLNFNKTLEEIESLKDIWPEIAKSVEHFFKSEHNKIALNELTQLLNIEYYKEKNISNNSKFFEKKVCITWSFENYKRPDLIKMLEEKWWNFVSSVSKNTDFLVAWEKAWSKLKKANELWVEVLGLDEFLEMI